MEIYNISISHKFRTMTGSTSKWYLILDGTFNTLGIILYMFLLFILIRPKNPKTIRNLLVINWVFTDFLTLAAQPNKLELFAKDDQPVNMVFLYQDMLHIHLIFNFATLLFICFFIVHSTYKLFSMSTTRVIIASIWGVLAIDFIYSSFVNYRIFFSVDIIFLIITYIILVTTVSIIYFVEKDCDEVNLLKENCQNPDLLMTTIYLLCNFLNFTSYVLRLEFDFYAAGLQYFYLTSYVNPLLQFYIIYRPDIIFSQKKHERRSWSTLEEDR